MKFLLTFIFLMTGFQVLADECTVKYFAGGNVSLTYTDVPQHPAIEACIEAAKDLLTSGAGSYQVNSVSIEKNVTKQRLTR